MSSAVPAYCHPAAYEAMRRELPAIDTPEGLLRAATAIALNDDPTASIDEVVETTRRLSDSIKRRLHSDSQEAAVAHLHDVMFDLIGFKQPETAEVYYDPRNSYLPQVLARRRGIPITMVLLYRAVAAPLGLRVDGVNAPGHFLAALHCREPTGDRMMYVDPFRGGDLLNREEAIARCECIVNRRLPSQPDPLGIATPVGWLRRMLSNLQVLFARGQQERDLLAMQELETLLPPE